MNIGNRLRTAAFAAALTLATTALPAVPTPQSWKNSIAATPVGGIVDITGQNLGSIPLFNTLASPLQDTGSYLLYSDDPETAEGVGVLYRDELPAGTNRLYIYHVNGLPAAHRISAVLVNNTGQTANVSIGKKSFPAPSANYIGVGKEGVRQFYENTNMPAPFTIPAGGRALLDPALDSATVGNNQLVAAIYDYTSDQPLTVATVMVGFAANTLDVYPGLTVLPLDGFNRQGTFPTNIRRSASPHPMNTANGMRKFRLGENVTGFADRPLQGYDAERQTETILLGNYGVTYELDVALNASGNEPVAILLAPRGGGYGGYIRWRLGDGDWQPTFAPSTQLTLADTTKAILCGVVPPPATITTLRIELIPAGASSTPIEIILAPLDPEPVPAPPEGWSVL